MESIRKWAEYYNSKGIAVYPTYVMRDSLKYSYEQPKEEVQSLDWEGAKWMIGLVGIGNLMVLKMNFKNIRKSAYISKVVVRCLGLLGHYHYPWIIMKEVEGCDQIFILLNSSLCDRFYIEGFDSISIQWDGIVEMPFDARNKHSDTHFFFNSLPLVKPARVSHDILKQAIATIIEEFGLFLDKG